MLRCDNDDCGKRLESGDKYAEVLVSIRTVDAPPPTYAAKFTLCDECIDNMLESF